MFNDSQLPSLATCTLNGQVVPCDQLPQWFWALPIVFGIFGIVLGVFWLWMLLDAIKHQTKDKMMWVLLIAVLNVLGAIIYYFSEKRGRK